MRVALAAFSSGALALRMTGWKAEAPPGPLATAARYSAPSQVRMSSSVASLESPQPGSSSFFSVML